MNSNQQLEIEKQRHSFAHILAFAVKRLFPDVKIGIGPVTETGFYYEFDSEHKFTHEDLVNIESEMQHIIEEDIPFTNIVIPREQALQTLLQLGETYKTELLSKIPDTEVSFYKTGDEFIDLCRGPHVKSTGELDNFKLIKVTKSYWLNDPSRPLMQKIIGVAFESKRKLTEYIKNMQRLSDINSIKIATKLELLTLTENLTASSPVWLKDGITLQHNIVRYLETQMSDYDINVMQPPLITDNKGILEEKFPKFLAQPVSIQSKNNTNYYFRNATQSFIIEKITANIDKNSVESNFAIGSVGKTLTGSIDTLKDKAPEHLEDFAERSYAFAVTLANEKNIKNLITKHIRLLGETMKAFGFSQFKVILEVPDYSKLDNYLYEEKVWDTAIEILKNVITELKLPSKIREGGAAFYGPRLTLEVKDKYARSWEISNLVLDRILAKELDLKYEGQEEQLILLHTYLVNNIEQLLDLILEHGEGSMPVWMEPVQVEIIALESKYNHKAIKIERDLKENDIRLRFDQSTIPSETKIASAINKHTPYIIIIGEKEANTDSISVKANGQDIGLMRVAEFIQKIQTEHKEELSI